MSIRVLPRKRHVLRVVPEKRFSVSPIISLFVELIARTMEWGRRNRSWCGCPLKSYTSQGICEDGAAGLHDSIRRPRRLAEPMPSGVAVSSAGARSAASPAAASSPTCEAVPIACNPNLAYFRLQLQLQEAARAVAAAAVPVAVDPVAVAAVEEAGGWPHLQLLWLKERPGDG